MSSAANCESELDISRRGRELAICVSSAEGYDCWAESYDRAPNPLLAREQRYLWPLLGRDYKRILDLACGTGRWLELLRAKYGNGVGIDCSGAMLGVAQHKNVIRRNLARALTECLPFGSALFDLVICSFALGHIKDLTVAARELARVMEAGADAFVSDLHPTAHNAGWRVGFEAKNRSFQIATVPRTLEQMVSEFELSGLRCLSHESLWLGEPEREIFERAGKSRCFAESCRLPAVLVFHFKRIDTAPIDSTSSPRPGVEA